MKPSDRTVRDAMLELCGDAVDPEWLFARRENGRLQRGPERCLMRQTVIALLRAHGFTLRDIAAELEISHSDVVEAVKRAGPEIVRRLAADVMQEAEAAAPTMTIQ